jgi:hypothetical protein
MRLVALHRRERGAIAGPVERTVAVVPVERRRLPAAELPLAEVDQGLLGVERAGDRERDRAGERDEHGARDRVAPRQVGKPQPREDREQEQRAPQQRLLGREYRRADAEGRDEYDERGGAANALGLGARPEGERRGEAEREREAGEEHVPRPLVIAVVGVLDVARETREAAADLVEELAPAPGIEQVRGNADPHESRRGRHQGRDGGERARRRPRLDGGDRRDERRGRRRHADRDRDASDRRRLDEPHPLRAGERREGAKRGHADRGLLVPAELRPHAATLLAGRRRLVATSGWP